MSFRIEETDGAAFLSFPEMSGFLVKELRERFGFAENDLTWYGDLAYAPKSKWQSDLKIDLKVDLKPDSKKASLPVPFFCRVAMKNPFLLYFDSIGDAAKALKSIQRNWASYNFQFFRRAALISEKLPYINTKQKKFPVAVPRSPIGLYMLIDEHTILASAETTSFLPAGKIEFIEDHENPPSRAYLKLWEALMHFNLIFGVDFPKCGEKCFDAGASPGGWTWVMSEMGCEVYAVDRAVLTPSLMQNALVTFKTHDAFTIEPSEIGARDWVLSDVICYPSRLYDWVQKWISSGLAKNMICTIKMQGEIDWQIVEKFADIENSTVIHLNYNKHELTWLWKGHAD